MCSEKSNISTTPSKKLAPCKLTQLNGVDGFELYIQNRQYGHYPISANHSSIESIRMAIADAKDYSYDGIMFTGEE